MRTQIWSNGGGVQSAAIAVLIKQGKLPKPDLAIISDTGYEMSGTWDYLDNHIQPLLDHVKVDVMRVSKDDYYEHGIFHGDNLLIPAFTEMDGLIGKQPGFCSSKWKADVVHKVCNELFPNNKFDMWLGISTDEMRRVRITDGKWRRTYPLVEHRLSRNDCMSIVENEGLPPPPRSSCYICPNHSDFEWRLLRDKYPADFEKACTIEKEVSEKNDRLTFFHSSGIPLNQVDFDSGDTLDMFGTCDSGMCFV